MSDWARNAPLLHLNYRNTRTVMIQNAHGIKSNDTSSFGSDIPIGTSEEGEVTLQVFYDGAQRAYRYELNGATFKEDQVLSKPLLRSPEKIIDDFVNKLSFHARNQDSSSSPEIAAKLLRNMGIWLWNEFIPKELAQQFWKHRSDIKRLTILGCAHSWNRKSE